MIETADDTAVHEPASLNRQGPSDKAYDECAKECKGIGPDDDIEYAICLVCKDNVRLN